MSDQSTEIRQTYYDLETFFNLLAGLFFIFIVVGLTGTLIATVVFLLVVLYMLALWSLIATLITTFSS